MTSTTERYRAAASQSASKVEKIADFWTQGSQKLTGYMPAVLPQGLTKAELSDQLGRRDLPKTGSIDELIERLVEADSK